MTCFKNDFGVLSKIIFGNYEGAVKQSCTSHEYIVHVCLIDIYRYTYVTCINNQTLL